MLESKEEYEALQSTLNSTGWAIFKREVQFEMKKHFDNAKKAEDMKQGFISLQKYKVVEDVFKKPYNLLNESEHKPKGDEQ